MKAFTVVTSPGADAPGREPTALTWLVMLVGLPCVTVIDTLSWLMSLPGQEISRLHPGR